MEQDILKNALSEHEQTTLNTRLIQAISQGRTQDIPVFLEQGADIHFDTDMVLDTAISTQQIKTFWFLIENYEFNLTKNWRVLRDAAAYGHKDIIDYLISQNVDLNLKGNIALNNCCLKDQGDMYQYLVEKGADTSKESECLNTAWLFGSFQVLQVLLQKDSNKAQFFDKKSLDYNFTIENLNEYSKKKPQEIFQLLSTLRTYSEDNYQYLKQAYEKTPKLTKEYHILLEKLECDWALKSQHTDMRDMSQQNTEAYQNSYKILGVRKI